MSAKNSQPTGIIPHLIVRDGFKAIEFYRQAFGATLRFDLPLPDGRLGHAELDVFGARMMLADEFPESGCISPPVDTPTTSFKLAAYVDDVDTAVSRAKAAGATIERAPQNEFYAERVAHVRDPFGHHWTLHTVLEEVSPEEMRRRMQQKQT